MCITDVLIKRQQHYFGECVLSWNCCFNLYVLCYQRFLILFIYFFCNQHVKHLGVTAQSFLRKHLSKSSVVDHPHLLLLLTASSEAIQQAGMKVEVITHSHTRRTHDSHCLCFVESLKILVAVLIWPLSQSSCLLRKIKAEIWLISSAAFRVLM